MKSISPLIPALFIAATVMTLTGPATAGLPDASQSDVPSLLIGSHVSIPFDVVVRDINGAAVAGATVTLDFSFAIPQGENLNLWLGQIAPATSDCATRTISMVAGADGRAIMSPYIGGNVVPALVQVSANGVPLAMVPARSIDVDGSGEIGINDLNVFRFNYFYAPLSGGTDYTGDNETQLADLEIFRTGYLFAVGIISPTCP